MSINYLRVEKLSPEALRKVFNKLPKKELIDMLIECNRIIDNIHPDYHYLPVGYDAINTDTITTASTQYYTN